MRNNAEKAMDRLFEEAGWFRPIETSPAPSTNECDCDDCIDQGWSSDDYDDYD